MTTPKDAIFTKILEENTPKAQQEKIKHLIKKIEGFTGRKLIVYVANNFMPLAIIKGEDVFGFKDILDSIDHHGKGDLLINSPGGVPDAAEKILIMCKEHFKEEFNTIVLDSAKSAATMICLGSDKIMMGYCAELGPVDPQIQLKGGEKLIPAQAYLSGLEYIRNQIKKEDNPDPLNMYVPILNKLSPEIISVCDASIQHSKELVEKWLREGMLKNNHPQAKKVSELLGEGKEYKSHGKVIDYKEAKDKLGLNVEQIDNDSTFWKLLWELYCRCTIHLRQINGVNLFASEKLVLTQTVNTKPKN